MPNLKNDTLLETDESQYLLVDGTRTATSLVVEGSSASALLRVTQTGAGNALVVEDSANPDSTPFVIDAAGNVGIGTTSPSYPLHIIGGTGSVDTVAMAVDVAGGNAGDSAGYVMRAVNTNELGAIRSYVETGYLSNMRFFTAGAINTLTERMRIDSAGNIGFGSATAAGYNMLAGKSLTGAVNTYGMVIQGQIQSDSTSSATTFASALSTAAAAFTVGTYTHFAAVGIATPGAGSTITNQVGFSAGSGITGATNNYGFKGDIASGANRYNLYMAGTADNYLAGSLGIGGTASAGQTLYIVRNITGATTARPVFVQSIIQSDVTLSAQIFGTGVSTQAAAFTLSNLTHFIAGQGSIGAGSTVGNQTGFYATAGLIGATNNWGFQGDIPAGANRWNLYMGGTANNYMAGRLGVGATLTTGAMAMVVNTTAADVGLIVRGAASQSGSLVSIQNSAASPLVTVSSTGEFAVTTNTTSNAPFQINAGLSGATTAFASIIQSTIASSVTSDASGYRTAIQTAAAAFTLTTLRHFSAGNATIGSTSAITNQIGFYAAGLSTASANYGFYGDVASGTNRYNLFMNGTADNYLAGNTGIGGPATANIKLAVTGGSTNSANPAIIVYGVSGSGTVSIFNDMGAGSYNSIVSAGSKGIIAAGANAATARASFVIAPWSDVDYGIRIEGGSTTNILHYGTAIFQPAAAASVAAVVKGRASQSANLQEWHNSAGSVVAYVAANGSSSFGTAADDAQAIIAGSVFS